MKYEWTKSTINLRNISDLISNRPEQVLFKEWCFDNICHETIVLYSISIIGEKLLKELNKPGNLEWLEAAIESELVKPVEQTFKIGDVIEFNFTDGDKKKVIINSTDFKHICLNTAIGARLNKPFIVKDEWEIKLSELKNVNMSLYNVKYIGHGAEYLI